MKLKFLNASVIKGIFESISSIIFEANMVVNKEGLKINAMDSSHICLVCINLKKSAFEIFEVDDDLKLGINLEDIVKILKRAKSTDEITLKNDSDKKLIIIEMNSPDSKSSRSFTLSLIDIDEEEVNYESLNEMEFSNTAIFSPNLIDDAIKDAEIYSEVLNVNCKKDLINFTSQGNIGNMSNDINKDEEKLDKYEYTEDSSGIFAISYLKNIIKIKTISPVVNMCLSSDAPLKLEFSFEDESNIVYFLAPRVEDEEDEAYEE